MLAQPFPTPAAAVAAEIARIALVVRRALRTAELERDLGADTHGYDVGLAHRELARLAHPIGRAPRLVDPELASLDERIEARTRTNAADRAATPQPMPLDVLAQRAQLDPVGLDLFLLALAPELDDGFARVYELLGGKRFLDLSTAGRVLAPDDAGARAVRQALSPAGALVRFGLLELSCGDGAPTLGTTISVPAPVVAFLLGHEAEDPLLRPVLVTAPRSSDAGAAHALLPRVHALLGDPGALMLLEGPAGAGKRSLVRAACVEEGRSLVELQLASGLPFTEREALAAARIAWLRGATLLVGLPPQDAEGRWRAGISRLLCGSSQRVVLCRDCDAPNHLDLRFSQLRLSPIWVPVPDARTRTELWRGQLHADVDCDALGRTYALTGGTIRRIAGDARVLAEAREGSRGAVVKRADVIAAIDAEFAPQLEVLGRRLPTTATFDDLVVADETRETLEELASTVALRDQVLDAWQFRPLVRGRGVSALFYGDPGTGKTMAAGVIAAAVGAPLYQIDTASLVSKWVGETEKNLAAVFRAAEARQAMLLFDEADAIFGKRTDVQNSTDRYANMQTNFLLTQLELFNGISILTTNRESGMDAAFKRRMTFRVCFPPPEADEREVLWRRMLAGRGARPAEVDWTELAEALPMSGGYIRNAVLRAGYLAAAGDVPITTELLQRAAKLVLRDAGKVI